MKVSMFNFTLIVYISMTSIYQIIQFNFVFITLGELWCFNPSKCPIKGSKCNYQERRGYVHVKKPFFSVGFNFFIILLLCALTSLLILKHDNINIHKSIILYFVQRIIIFEFLISNI